MSWTGAALLGVFILIEAGIWARSPGGPGALDPVLRTAQAMVVATSLVCLAVAWWAGLRCAILARWRGGPGGED